MKRINTLLVGVILLTFLSGCGEPSPENLQNSESPEEKVELGLLDRALLKLFSVPEQKQMLKVELSSQNYINKEFWDRYESNVKPIQDRMNEQITNQLGENWYIKDFNKDPWTGYYYNVGCWNTSIKEITIVANKSLFGEDVGSNIVDRFTMGVWEYVFDVDGNLVAYSEVAQKALHYSTEEWIGNDYFCPQEFFLFPSEEVSLSGENVLLSISIALANGLKYEESISIAF